MTARLWQRGSVIILPRPPALYNLLTLPSQPSRCAIVACMGEWLREVLKGMGSTLDVYPSEVPPIEVKDPKERLSRSWVRTGQAIQRAIHQFECEQNP